MRYRFSGQAESTADDKNRYRFPAKYKDCYACVDDFNNETIQDVYVLKTAGTKYLTIFPKQIALNFMDQLAKFATLKDSKESNVARAYLSSLEAVKVDSQGRFTVKKESLGNMKLSKDVVIIGMGSKLELWNKSEYQEYLREMESIELDAESSLGNIVIGLE